MPSENYENKVMKDADGGRKSSLRKGKVMMKEESKDYEEATTSTSLIIGQSSLKKIYVSRGVLLKDIGVLHGALL